MKQEECANLSEVLIDHRMILRVETFSLSNYQKNNKSRDTVTVSISLQTTDNLFTWGHKSADMPHFAAHSRIITLSSEVKLM